jgi:hypothetical protein
MYLLEMVKNVASFSMTVLLTKPFFSSPFIILRAATNVTSQFVHFSFCIMLQSFQAPLTPSSLLFSILTP